MNNGPQISEATPGAQTEKRSAAKSLSFIVAEDDRVNQMVLRSVLQKMGHTARVVSNGREAVEAFRESIPDAMLLDIQMPEMDGLEAAKTIRSLESGPSRVPIIAMTGMSAEEDHAAGAAAGFDRYLCKPVRAEKLLTVTQWLFEKRGET